MPYNELLVPDYTSEKERLTLLFNEVVSSLRSNSLTTQEEMLSEWANALGTFFDTAGKSIFQGEHVVPDTGPEVGYHNRLFQDLANDLAVLFIRLKSLGNLVVYGINQTLTEQDDLIGRIRKVASLLGDLEMYEGTSGELVSEHFTNISGINLNSTLLALSECEIVLEEGIITLDQTNVTNVNISQIIVDQLDGVLGNNEEPTPHRRNHLEAIKDFNPDTWVEFEKTYHTSQIASVESLNVNLILTLEQPTIINRIMIDPVNFGTLDDVEIVDIRISRNGTDWKSIRGNIPLASYLNETEEDVYILSPASSLYYGKFAYSFLPYKTKMISIKLRKKAPFLFTTEEGTQKYRVAIGLRSIDISSVEYASESEIISLPITLNQPANKLSMLAAYRPTASTMGKVKFFVSTDGGVIWYPIQPLDRDSFKVAEILELPEDTTSFIWKAVLQRNDSAFTNNSEFDDEEANTKTKIEATEVSTVASPQLFSPIESLANDNVYVMETLGARGAQLPKRPMFNLGPGVGEGASLSLTLPYRLEDMVNPKKEMIVTVNDVQWSPIDSLIGMWVHGAKVYELNIGENKIKFGDGTSGPAPPAGAAIRVGLVPEDLNFEPSDLGHSANMEFSSDGLKETILIERLGRPSAMYSSVVGRDLTVVNLDHKRIIDNTFTIIERNITGVVQSSGTYQIERSNPQALTQHGHYYVDWNNGIIYSYSPSSLSHITTVGYKYFLSFPVTNYELSTAVNGFDKVILPPSSFTSEPGQDDLHGTRTVWDWNGYNDNQTGTNVLDSANGHVINLSQTNIVKGSIVLPNETFGPSVEPQEVAFVDGYSEINQNLIVQAEPIPMGSTGTVHTEEITLLSQAAPLDTIFQATGLTFSNPELFTNLVGAPVPLSPAQPIGDYYIDYSTPTAPVLTVSVAASTTDLGTIAYQYVSSTMTNPNGIYSVDYPRGMVYCKTATSTLTPGLDVILYRFAKYRIHYNIIRVLPPEEVITNVEANQVSIETWNLLGGKLRVLYEYIPELSDNLTEIVNHYTPIVRDIRFRALGSLI